MVCPTTLSLQAQIIPERGPVFAARLGQAEEGVPAITSHVASCSGTDLPPGDVTADVVF